MTTDQTSTQGSIDPDFRNDLEYAIAPEHDDERAYFVRRALKLARKFLTDHPHYEEVIENLEEALDLLDEGRESAAVNFLRGAYSLLPYRHGDGETATSGDESGREADPRAFDPGDAPLDVDVTVRPDVDISRETWDAIEAHARDELDRGKDPYFAYWDSVYEFVRVTPTIVVDGEAKDPGDLPGVDEPPEDSQPADSPVQSEAKKVLRAIDTLESVDVERLGEPTSGRVIAALDRLANTPDPMARQLTGMSTKNE